MLYLILSFGSFQNLIKPYLINTPPPKVEFWDIAPTYICTYEIGVCVKCTPPYPHRQMSRGAIPRSLFNRFNFV